MDKFKYVVYLLCVGVLITLIISSTRVNYRRRPFKLVRPGPPGSLAYVPVSGTVSPAGANGSGISAVHDSKSWTSTSSSTLAVNVLEEGHSVNMGSDVVPMAAYFDGRRFKSHKNATVIFVALLEKLVGNIKGCVVDRTEQRNHMARPIFVSHWIKQKHPVSHTEVFVWCYDMKITSTSNVSLLFNSLGSLVEVPVRRKGVVMPSKGSEKDQVMVCATGYGSPDYLDQWLLYQQKIGVQFIHLNVDVSFVQNLNKSEVLRDFIASNYVKMDVWSSLNKSQVFLHSQTFKYQDCILRYQNHFKYMMIIDFDEYFTPLGAEKNVLYYAKRLLRGKIASVMLPSTRYYCKLAGFDNMSLPKDGNMTTMFDTSISTPQEIGKSIQIVKLVEETSVHGSAYNMPSYRNAVVSRRGKCYISHLTSYPWFTSKCKN